MPATSTSSNARSRTPPAAFRRNVSTTARTLGGNPWLLLGGRRAGRFRNGAHIRWRGRALRDRRHRFPAPFTGRCPKPWRGWCSGPPAQARDSARYCCVRRTRTVDRDAAIVVAVEDAIWGLRPSDYLCRLKAWSQSNDPAIGVAEEDIIQTKHNVGPGRRDRWATACYWRLAHVVVAENFLCSCRHRPQARHPARAAKSERTTDRFKC